MSRAVRRGFVLLEAVVALAVVGLCAAAALELFASHLRAAGRIPQRLTAAALAQDRMTAVRLLEPRQLRHVPDSIASGQFPPPFASYRWRAAVTPSVADDLYDIRVEISWPDGAYTISARETAVTSPVPSRMRGMR